MAKPRKGLSKRQRFEVFKRDRFSCQYCGKSPPAVILEADHIVPLAEGGEDHERNLLTACQDCNRGKAAVPLSMVPRSLADQSKERQERQEQTRAYNDLLLELREAEINSVRRLWQHWTANCGWAEGTHADRDREQTLKTFLRRLPEAEILDSIDIAFVRMPPHWPHYDDKTWRYFCGVCWKKIKEPKDGTQGSV
jgi:hypothetical protein